MISTKYIQLLDAQIANAIADVEAQQLPLATQVLRTNVLLNCNTLLELRNTVIAFSAEDYLNSL